MILMVQFLLTKITIIIVCQIFYLNTYFKEYKLLYFNIINNIILIFIKYIFYFNLKDIIKKNIIIKILIQLN